MLFGSEELQEKILEGIKKCEREREVKVVYGAVLGSISRGTQFADSDYDTRFLFIKKDYPDKIVRHPEKLQEKELIYRMPLKNTCFEQFSFWEITAFLHYMVYPAIDGRFSTGLYAVVGDTMLSPYVWDPYGIRQKLIPLLKVCFHKDYYIDSRRKMLAQTQWDHYGGINAKGYLKALHTALSIEYADQFQEFPPVYLPALLQTAPYELRDQVLRTVKQAQKEARECVQAYEAGDCHYTGSVIIAERVEIFDEYINRVMRKFDGYEMRYLSCDEQKILEEQLGWGYEVLKRSIFEEEPVMEQW